ncbi:GyrI-like domain-containing protein [Clostridium sp. C2-6-12]|uniref:AraC family transcriptional regulator n=1 Tax=Clostridium sp. C2-6-12 TaxID=2698832 RepID=UPI0013699365|nr:GyrI-like domain-containing protein [Clostridium sp. C2-6-12]
MNIDIEMIPAYKIAYIRKIGPYGPQNVEVMEQLKSWAKEKDLIDEDSIILGIAQDNPEFTEPKACRYDTCLVVSEEFKADDNNINLGKIIGGRYCVFTINHTADAMEKAWREIFSELAKANYEYDAGRPILERYALKMINKHLCEICIPIL